MPAPRIGIAPPGGTGAGTRPGRVAETTFTTQASGSCISVDGHNDCDVACHCGINFAWTVDGETGGPRGACTPATLPARQQVTRAVFIAGPHHKTCFVGLPRWHCRPTGRAAVTFGGKLARPGGLA